MNEYLMSFYDEYAKTKTITKLEEFVGKTFPKDGTDKLFIGCTLILITTVYKTRTTAEALKIIVASVKESVGDTNLMQFYIDRVNGNKMVSKYLCKELKSEHLQKHADMILDWLEGFCFNFSKTIQNGYKEKIDIYKEK